MSHDASPTARALLALELVQSSPGITADRIADRLGVSERAARRYVGILREANIPIESASGPYGGYRLGRGMRLPPLMFSATEALGLVMAVLDGHHDASDAGDAVGSALGKIVRALPQSVATQAEAVRRTAAPAPDRAAARPDPGTTTELVQACADHLLEEHLATGWEYDVEILIEAPFDAVAPCVAPALGRLEPVDAEACRLVGSTSNPRWYAEQLAAIPASYRIVRGPELAEAARQIGQQLMAAAQGHDLAQTRLADLVQHRDARQSRP